MAASCSSAAGLPAATKSGPAELAERLTHVINKIHAASAPPVLTRPSVNKLNELREALIGLAAERETGAPAAGSPQAEQPAQGDAQDHSEGEAEAGVGRGIADIQASLGLSPSPWQNPMALRDLRAKEARLSDGVAELRKLQLQRIPGRRVPRAVPYWDPQEIRNEALLNLHAASMMTRQEHAPVWAMVHAAGVSDTCLIKDQSPAAFDKVWAPKGSAQYQISYLGAWRP